MSTNFDSILQLSLCIAAKVFPIALSFADDLLFFVLAKLGVGIPGLSWIGPLFLTASILLYFVRWMMQRRVACSAAFSTS